MILSKHPLKDIDGEYDKRMPVHHMGYLSATVQPKGVEDRFRVVNVHLVPNFEGHWKGPILHFLGERDVPSIQAEQIQRVSEHVAPYGDDWCVCGDYNFEGPSILGHHSRHQEITCPGGENSIVSSGRKASGLPFLVSSA